MKFESEIVYRMPISRNEMYIRGLFDALNIKEFYKKEVAGMFDTEKIEAYYADVKAKCEEAVALEMANFEQELEERFAQKKAEIAEELKAEKIAKAEAPFKHDIELCEKVFKKDEVAEEEIVEEIREVEGEC